MNNIKKLTFIILLLTMMVLIPTFTLATENIAKIGDKEYSTIQEAIEEIPNDNQEVTISLLKDVKDAVGGFKVQAGQNIVIDFNGHTYNASKPLVGSTGTETNGCQLLKGSKVTFKNGTLASETAKILIQNYCDLTLDNMTIDTSNSPENLYAMSNNNGKVEITGNTSIIAKKGQVAFDVCWAPKVENYKNGTQVVVNTTGKIVGNIELGLWNKDDSPKDSKSTLLIKNINHDGNIVFADKELEKNLTIQGGVFSSNVNDYVANNYYAKKQANGKYLVKEIVDIAKCDITGISDKTYTGKALTQSIVVKYNGETLKENDDYIINYSNNTKPGKASVTIKGKEAYKGTETKTFIIMPNKLTGLKIKSKTTSSVKLSWSKQEEVTGYNVYSYNYKNKKWEYVNTTSETSYTVNKLNSSTTYKYRVRAYKDVDGIKYFGGYTSNVKTATKPKTPVANTKSGDRKITITWKKITGATGYKIYMATSKNAKYTKIKTITNNKTFSYTKSGLKTNKKYYFKIIAYKQVDDEQVFSSYSDSVKATTKKVYTVKKGNTLYSIAKKYKTTVKKLAKINKIKNANMLKIGLRLLLN